MGFERLDSFIKQKDKRQHPILWDLTIFREEGYSIDNVFDGGFSSTEADKTKKYQLYLEEHDFRSSFKFVKCRSATVSLSMPADDGTIISKDKEALQVMI